MPLIPNTGIDEIDKGHRETLIYLYQLESSSAGADLDVFSDYLKNHTQLEEDFMLGINYPDTQLHISDHHRIESIFTNLRSAEILFDRERLSQAVTLLSRELLVHIKTFDLALGEWIQKRG